MPDTQNIMKQFYPISCMKETKLRVLTRYPKNCNFTVGGEILCVRPDLATLTSAADILHFWSLLHSLDGSVLAG